jgi:serine/threonine protein phosphatase PrpC
MAQLSGYARQCLCPVIARYFQQRPKWELRQQETLLVKPENN